LVPSETAPRAGGQVLAWRFGGGAVTRPAGWSSESAEDAGASRVLEAFARVMASVLASGQVRPAAGLARPLPMLTVQQVAVLLGMSRMTVIRKADAGELPCVVVSRGTRQRMRRFPRAAIEELAADGGGGAQADLAEFTARWLGARGVDLDAQGRERHAG